MKFTCNNDGGSPFPTRRCFCKDDGRQTPIIGVCTVINAIITLWVLVSMTLIFGVYGSVIYKIRPHESILIKPNPLFVDNVKVERIGGAENEVMLYGFDGTPPRNVSSSFAETRRANIPGGTYSEWKYSLLSGAQFDISYDVTSLPPSHVVLVVVEGDQGLNGVIPLQQNSILWNPIYGTGATGLRIPKSAGYYVVAANFNSHIVEVTLDIGIRSLHYDPTNAYYKCTTSAGACAMKISITGGNSALMAFFAPNLLSEFLTDIGNHKTHVRLSYGPRWITYLSFTGGVIILISLVSRCLNKSQSTSQVESSPKENIEFQGAPRIPRKDDDAASLFSSYDSLPQDEDDPLMPHNRNAAIDHDFDNDSSHLCYACGTKIAEVGSCPIRQEPLKLLMRFLTC